MAVQQYLDQAKTQYDVGYNAKVQAQKNALAQTLGSLEGQKVGVNANYDQQVQGQNLNNSLNKNSTSNAILGRGLNNSSIAVSGLAEQDAKNTRLVGNINNSRTGALGQIDLNKQLQTQNSNATLGQMAGSREDAIQALAMQLEGNAWDKDYKNQQLALSRQNAQASQAYQNAQLQFEKDKYASTQAKANSELDSDVASQLQYITSDQNTTGSEKYQQLSSMYKQYMNNGAISKGTMDDMVQAYGQYTVAMNGEKASAKAKAWEEANR